jgi:DNA-binding GntR family transcriptional regulator
MPVTLPVTLDRDSSVPLYVQLSEQLLQGIEAGRVRAGDPLETEVELADRLNLSRPTVRRAIAELVARGLLVRRRGIGTVVASRWVHRMGRPNSIYDDLTTAKRAPVSRLLELDFDVTHRKAATQLDLPVGTPLIHITRLRLVGALPLAILENWLPPTTPVRHALTPDRLERTGLYALMREHGVHPVNAVQTFGARNATGRERSLLKLSRADPLLTMSRRAYDDDGTPIECGEHCYRGDQYAIEVAVGVDER